MARTTNGLSQMIWNRKTGALDYVPISSTAAKQEGEDQLSQGKRLEKVEMGFWCCFHSSDSCKIILISRDDRVGRLWNWLWTWMGAKTKSVNMSCILVSARRAWRRVFWKVRAELRKSMRPRAVQRFTYDAYSYSQNFDEGCWKDHQEFNSSVSHAAAGHGMH